MSKRVKDLVAGELRRRYEGIDGAVLVDPTGIDAVTNNELRSDLRARSIRLEVVKNSLARRAFADGPLAALSPLLTGPIALATGGDSIVDVAKVVAEWGKKIGLLAVRGGLMEGKLLPAEEAAALASMPGRRELHQQVAGLALAPGSGLVAAMGRPASVVAGCVEAIIKKLEGAEAAA